jgi:hypothetical protein
MAAIIDEFGEVASTVVGPDGQVEPERILAHAPGIMFKYAQFAFQISDQDTDDTEGSCWSATYI